MAHALALAATKPGARWLGRSAVALFNEREDNHQAAIKECLNPERPLLTKNGEGGALTAAGFEKVAGGLPEAEVGPLAATVAGGLPPTERAAFLQAVISRTPHAAAELTPVFEQAVAAEKAAHDARVTAATAQKATDDANRAALARAMELIEVRRQNRLDAVRREWVALGEDAAGLPKHPPIPPEPDPVPQPRTAADKDFRRATADRLVSAWLYNARHQKTEAATALERLLRGIAGVSAIGRAGEEVAFNGRVHECKRGVADGETVRIALPGWTLDGEDGVLLNRALVE